MNFEDKSTQTIACGDTLIHLYDHVIYIKQMLKKCNTKLQELKEDYFYTQTDIVTQQIIRTIEQVMRFDVEDTTYFYSRCNS